MRDPLIAAAEAYAPNADWAGRDVPARPPEGLVRWLALFILFLLQPLHALRMLRSGRLSPSWWHDRPDLPLASAQAEAASVRGQFGNSIRWLCLRHGIGPGHADWPELSRAIVAFGGSLEGFRAGAPPRGLAWWENPGVVPGMVAVPGFGLFAATTTSVLQQPAVADALPPAPNALQTATARAPLPASLLPASLLPASWLPASVRHVFARAGPQPSTGPPDSPELPLLPYLTHGATAWLAPLS